MFAISAIILLSFLMNVDAYPKRHIKNYNHKHKKYQTVKSNDTDEVNGANLLIPDVMCCIKPRHGCPPC